MAEIRLNSKEYWHRGQPGDMCDMIAIYFINQSKEVKNNIAKVIDRDWLEPRAKYLIAQHEFLARESNKPFYEFLNPLGIYPFTKTKETSH